MDTLQDLPPDARFMHAYTNSAHPTASAVALRNLEIIEKDRLIENARIMGERLGQGLRSALGTHPHVDNIRQLGLMAGLSLIQDRESGTRFDPSQGTGGRVAKHMRENGSVITRFVVDEIVFAQGLLHQATCCIPVAAVRAHESDQDHQACRGKKLSCGADAANVFLPVFGAES